MDRVDIMIDPLAKSTPSRKSPSLLIEKSRSHTKGKALQQCQSNKTNRASQLPASRPTSLLLYQQTPAFTSSPVRNKNPKPYHTISPDPPRACTAE